MSTYIPKADKMSIRPPKFTFAYLGQNTKHRVSVVQKMVKMAVMANVASW